MTIRYKLNATTFGRIMESAILFYGRAFAFELWLAVVALPTFEGEPTE